METTLLKNPLADLDKSLKPIEKVMVIISKGTLESVYAGFILANGARMEGMEAEIFFTFFGLDAVIKDRLKDIHVATVGNPAMHMPTMLGGLPGISASGCRLWVCKLAFEMFDLKEEDLTPEVEGILTVGDFYARAAGEGTQIIFI